MSSFVIPTPVDVFSGVLPIPVDVSWGVFPTRVSVFSGVLSKPMDVGLSVLILELLESSCCSDFVSCFGSILPRLEM